MPEVFPKDDVTRELAIVIDEYSAVNCYQMKKNLPLKTPSKKVLSYKTILNTNYPGTSPRDCNYKLPESIDLDYIEMISGKSFCKQKKEDTTIPITMKSFEKLCYKPELTKSQRQALVEKELREQGAFGEKLVMEQALKEKEEKEQDEASKPVSELIENILLNEDVDDSNKEESTCSPCCFPSKKSEDVKENEEALSDVLQTFPDDFEHEDTKPDNIAPSTSQSSEISEPVHITPPASKSSDISGESPENVKEKSLIATESQNGSVPKTSSNQESKKESSEKKNKKSIFGRLFSSKEKNKKT